MSLSAQYVIDLPDSVRAELDALGPQSMAEALLETAISVEMARLMRALEKADRVECFEQLERLHQQRTPNQVRRMELMKGLVK